MPFLRRIRIALLVVSALLALPRPAAAQHVRQGTLIGYETLLRRFANAADRQSRTDWFGPPYDHSGTAVLVTFDAHNADVALVVPHDFGTSRLLGLSKTLATQMGYLWADYILRDGSHTVTVDIELNKYLHRERYRTTFSLDLSRLAAGLNALPLPGPVVIGMDATTSTSAVIARPGARMSMSRYWFIAASQVAAGTTLAYKAEVTPLLIMVLLALVALVFLPVVFLIRRGRKLVAATPEANRAALDPATVQRMYDRSLPRWMFSAIIAGLAVVMSLFMTTGARSIRVAFDFLLPGGRTALTLLPLGVTVFVLLTRIWMARVRRTAPTPRTPAQQDAAGAMRRFAPLLVLFLIPPVLLMLQMAIPVYTQAGLVQRRTLTYVVIGLTPFLFALALYKASKGMRTRLTEGPWFDMVQDVAAHAGVTVRRVFTVRSRIPNAYATAFGSVGMTAGLVEQMEPEEVRAVLAHEIGHLMRRHPQRTLAATLAANACFIALWTAMEYFATKHSAELGRTLTNSIVVYMVFLNFFVALVTGAGRRRREREADEFAVDLTNDPELVIRALTKIHDLAYQPHRLRASDEILQAHPSLDARIEAIRKR